MVRSTPFIAAYAARFRVPQSQHGLLDSHPVFTGRQGEARVALPQRVARLKSGATLSQAREDMNAIARQLSAEFPDNNRGIGVVAGPCAKGQTVGDTRIGVAGADGRGGLRVNDRLRQPCGTVAGARAGVNPPRRWRCGTALGASRARLISQMVAQGALIALAGGILGVGALAPGGYEGAGHSGAHCPARIGHAALDLPVLLFALGLSIYRRGLQRDPGLAGFTGDDE